MKLSDPVTESKEEYRPTSPCLAPACLTLNFTSSLFREDLEREGFHALRAVQSAQLPTPFCLSSTKQT